MIVTVEILKAANLILKGFSIIKVVILKSILSFTVRKRLTVILQMTYNRGQIWVFEEQPAPPLLDAKPTEIEDRDDDIHNGGSTSIASGFS